MDVPYKDIFLAVRELSPVPHRLEIKKISQDIALIDDAFNSNPVGAKAALEILGLMDGARRILITPGMIELGSKEYEYNKLFGEQAAAVCDHVILVGKKRALPIQEGLENKDFPDENIFIAANLNEALTRMRSMMRSGDIFLIENDLPDNYNE